MIQFFGVTKQKTWEIEDYPPPMPREIPLRRIAGLVLRDEFLHTIINPNFRPLVFGLEFPGVSVKRWGVTHLIDFLEVPGK